MADHGTVTPFRHTETGPVPVEWEVVPLYELATEFFSGGTSSTNQPEF
jgi:restriction endonuclease S subunit